MDRMSFSVVVRTSLAVAFFASISAYHDSQYYLGRNYMYQRQYYNGGRFGGILPNQRCQRPLTKRNCRLFNFGSNLVTKDDFITMITTVSDGWFPLYTIEIGSPVQFGKCRNRFVFDGQNEEFFKEDTCFIIDSQTCETFVETMIITEDDCGRVRLVSVNGTSEETAYSQDLNKYFWREICYDQNEAGVCVGGYFIDLVVKTDRRIITEDGDSVDLTSVPWASIAADLKTVFGRDFKDPELRFEEIGKGCIF